MPASPRKAGYWFAGRKMIGDAVAGPAPLAPTINRPLTFRPRFYSAGSPWSAVDERGRPGRRPTGGKSGVPAPATIRPAHRAFVELAFPTRVSTEPSIAFYLFSERGDVRVAGFLHRRFVYGCQNDLIEAPNRNFGTCSAEIPRYVPRADQKQ
jgi:hypothetical protein